ncbi:amidohydrolase [Bosea sp. (in: a-proteobacteria)]|uniref:amidohydrolase n=1 Tax=Bosea sp. (in: a-proteobacteria) TaxID=1871050 RepID=UPI0027359C51|nr:amidohydrolase [Bosea sp. (in: a-proteobacteria)]MDP3407002.1 amidohydrolase [Bosea sp. (in: a-proteobacteria)]
MPSLPHADLVLQNGPVYLGLKEGYASAVALWAGKVLATGTPADMAPLIGPGTKVIDLAGRMATPGLYEAHLHLLPLGLTMKELDIRPRFVRTLDGLLEMIAQAAAKVKPGEWILARGYDHFELDVKRHPHRTELDRAAPYNPVYIVRACGHLSVANSLALKLAGVDEKTPVPAGGAIEQVNGVLTGLMAENGRDPVKKVIPDPTDEELVAAIERAGRYCNSFGITSVMDAAVGMRSRYREVAAYRTAQRTGRLPVRTNMCLLGGHNGIVEQCFADGLVTGAGDDWLSVGPVKIFTDGSAGGRTAAMSLPYLGEPETTGIFCLTDAEMDALTRDYHAKGYQLAVHAIGDAAIEQTLNAMENGLNDHPDADRRHRIEHCGFNSKEQIARMVRLGIEPVPQPVFIYDFGDLYLSVLEADRVEACYPMRDWIEAGLKPAASSDAPVCDANIWPNIYTMLTRKTARGTVISPDQTLTIDEVISAYTEFGAYVNRCEDSRGRLLPGMAADVAIFSRDLSTATPEQLLHETRCDMTIIAGKVVYEADA